MDVCREKAEFTAVTCPYNSFWCKTRQLLFPSSGQAYTLKCYFLGTCSIAQSKVQVKTHPRASAWQKHLRQRGIEVRAPWRTLVACTKVELLDRTLKYTNEENTWPLAELSNWDGLTLFGRPGGNILPYICINRACMVYYWFDWKPNTEWAFYFTIDRTVHD